MKRRYDKPIRCALGLLVILSLFACAPKTSFDKASSPARSASRDTALIRQPEKSEQGTGQEEKISIDADDHHIFGTWMTPEGEYDSAVLLLHGFGANRECGGMFTDFAAALAEENHMASFRFDFAGRGESDLDYSKFSLAQGTEDVDRAVQWLKEKYPGIRHYYLLGQSMGGTITILDEAKNPGTYDGIITWAGAVDLTVLFTDDMVEYAKENGTYTMHLSWLDRPLDISYDWFKECEEMDLCEESSKGTAPLFAVGGMLDDTVPAEDARKLATVRSDARSDCLIYDDADHMFRGVRERLYEDTLNYLKQLESSR